MKNTVLVLTEHDNQTLKPCTYHTLAAAEFLSKEITLLIVGYGCETVAKQASRLAGVKKVLYCDSSVYQYPLAEEIAALLQTIASNYQAILAPATTFGKNCLPRLAGLLGLSQVSDVIKILSPNTFIRPLYAGNVLATVQSFDPIKLLTIRPTAFEPLGDKAACVPTAPIEPLKPLAALQLSTFVKRERNPTARPDLSTARIVIAGGRGLQNKENFKLLEELADLLGAAIGASRAAVDAGFLPNDYQVGQTGKIVAPELYIAVGISGAIQHVAGMKDSKVVVAINKDPEANIFQVADYGLVGDLFQILPELKQEVSIRQQTSGVK